MSNFPYTGGFIPSALIMINNDLTDQVLEFISRQLFLTDILDGYDFLQTIDGYDGYDFLPRIKRQNRRVAVIQSHQEKTHRDLFDLVLFVKNGLASVECNKFGPPGLTLPVTKLYWGILGVYDT
jgi:hypothetical protein